MRYLCFTAGSENALFARMFADLEADSRVRLTHEVPKHSGALYALHHRRGLNRKRPAPLRCIWASSEYETEIRNEHEAHDGLCLIFNNFSLHFFEPSQLKIWQKKYGVKLVLVYIDRYDSWFSAQARMYENVISFDKVYTYSRPDAERYGKEYFDCYYSMEELPAAEDKCDVYFWGSDTGRRSILEEVYDKLDSMGVKVKLGICYTQGSHARKPGIVYDEPKEYGEILKDIAGAGVLLDIIAGEGGVSLRYFEALAYGKKLISNNPEIKRMRFYDPRQMLYVKSPQDISGSFMSSTFTPYPYAGEFSPVHFIDQLEKYFI